MIDQRLTPFTPVKYTAQGSVHVNRNTETLVQQALDWITEDVGLFEDQRINHMILREVSSQTPNGEMHHTGKTARKKKTAAGGSNGAAE